MNITTAKIRPYTEKIMIPAYISVGGVLAEATDRNGVLDLHEISSVNAYVTKADLTEYELEESKSNYFFLTIDPYEQTVTFMKQEHTEWKPEEAGNILHNGQKEKLISAAAKDLAEKNLYFRFNEDQDRNAEYFSVNIEQFARIANYNEDEVNFKRVDLPKYDADIIYMLSGKAAKDAGEVTLEWKGNEAKFMTDVLNIMEIDEMHDSRDDMQKFEITHIQWNKRQGATENFVAITYTEEAARIIAQGYANAIVRGEEK